MEKLKRPDYKYLLEEFSEKKIKERYMFLYAKMEDFIKTLNIDYAKINGEILEQVVLDYFADIYRLKDFHGIEKVNKKKIIACESFWLLRRKPIQLIEDIDSENERIDIFMNERFIMSYLTQEFLMPSITVPPNEDIEIKLGDYIKHLYYHLKYRYIDQQYLELILYSFEIGRLFENTVEE